MRRQITELVVDVHVDGATLGNNMLQASNQETSISHSQLNQHITTRLLESIHNKTLSRALYSACRWLPATFTGLSFRMIKLYLLPGKVWKR